MSENCCICLEDGKTACRLSEMDQTGRSYQNKLEKIAVEIVSRQKPSKWGTIGCLF